MDDVEDVVDLHPWGVLSHRRSLPTLHCRGVLWWMHDAAVFSLGACHGSGQGLRDLVLVRWRLVLWRRLFNPYIDTIRCLLKPQSFIFLLCQFILKTILIRSLVLLWIFCDLESCLLMGWDFLQWFSEWLFGHWGLLCVEQFALRQSHVTALRRVLLLYCREVFFVVRGQGIKLILLHNNFITSLTVCSRVPRHLLKISLILSIALPYELCIQHLIRLSVDHLIRRVKKFSWSSLGHAIRWVGAARVNLYGSFDELLLLWDRKELWAWAWNGLVFCHWDCSAVLLRHTLGCFYRVVCLLKDVFHFEDPLFLVEIVEFWNASWNWVWITELRGNQSRLFCSFKSSFIAIGTHWAW